MKQTRRRSGFTLIELMITIAIIGILSAIIFPSFSKIQTKAKESALKSTGHTLQMSLESNAISNGKYPISAGQSGADLAQTLITNGDLGKLPTNPFTGTAITNADPSGKVTYTSDGATYSLQLYGKNNQSVILTLTNE